MQQENEQGGAKKLSVKKLNIEKPSTEKPRTTRPETRKPSVKKLRPKKVIIIAVCVVGAAALALLGIFIYRTVINPGAAFTLPEQTPAQTGPGQTGAQDQGQNEAVLDVDKDFMKGRVNILVMGMDASEERMETERQDFRTDTMLLVTIDFNNGTVDMITTPRDSYVEVTKATGALYKVNSAAYFGGGLCDNGFKNACDTISGVFGGIPVPYYVGVDMDGLKALIDAMDGVDYDMDLDFTGDSGQAYKKGPQHLDSTQVLDYLRLRKGFGTDVDRQARQRKMLLAIFKQLADSGQIKNLPAIYQSLKDMVYTNLSFEQICALVVFGTGFDDWDNVGQYTLPGGYHNAYGVFFYLLDQQGKADLVRKVFSTEIGIDKKHDINYVLAHSEDTGSDDEISKDEDEEEALPKPTKDKTEPTGVDATSAPGPSATPTPGADATQTPETTSGATEAPTSTAAATATDAPAP